MGIKRYRRGKKGEKREREKEGKGICARELHGDGANGVIAGPAGILRLWG